MILGMAKMDDEINGQRILKIRIWLKRYGFKVLCIIVISIIVIPGVYIIASNVAGKYYEDSELSNLFTTYFIQECSLENLHTNQTFDFKFTTSCFFSSEGPLCAQRFFRIDKVNVNVICPQVMLIQYFTMNITIPYLRGGGYYYGDLMYSNGSIISYNIQEEPFIFFYQGEHLMSCEIGFNTTQFDNTTYSPSVLSKETTPLFIESYSVYNDYYSTRVNTYWVIFSAIFISAPATIITLITLIHKFMK